MSELTILLFLFLIIIIGLIVLAGLIWYQRHYYRTADFAKIDRMSGVTFERFLGELFRSQGYTVSFTPDTGDFGADLILEKDGVRTAVQAKRYHGNVGIAAIQEVIGAKRHHQCTKAMVVTNSYFTDAAWKLAMSNYVWLIHRDRLLEMIKVMQKDIKNKLSREGFSSLLHFTSKQQL